MTPLTLAVNGPGFNRPQRRDLGRDDRAWVLSTAVAYVLYCKILEASGATNLLLVTLLIPVSAILLGSLFLNESLETVHFVGMALIAVGLSVIDGRLWRRRVVPKVAS